MPKYVILANWTEQGVRNATETVQRTEQVRARAEALGGHLEQVLWTLGRHDLVAIFDMPSDEAVAAVGLQVGMAGASRTESLRAFSADEMTGILGQLDAGTSGAGFDDRITGE